MNLNNIEIKKISLDEFGAEVELYVCFKENPRKETIKSLVTAFIGPKKTIGCEYCLTAEGNTSTKPLIKVLSSKIFINGGHLVATNLWGGQTQSEIKFCPMCGTSLRASDTEYNANLNKQIAEIQRRYRENLSSLS